VLKSLADSLSDAERDTLSKKIQLIFETATGEYLDEYGKWFGVSRYPNEDDNDYRERIKYYLLIPRSTVQGIIEGIQYYLNDTKAHISIYEPWKNIFYLNKSNLNGDDHLPGYYYRYAVIDVHIDRPMSQAIHDAIEAFKPAGVKFYVTVDGNLGEDVKRLILADFKVTRLDTINRMFGFNYARILPFTFSDRLDTLVQNTNYFKTNDSKLNGSDVLAGSPLHNVTYWNKLKTSLGEDDATPEQRAVLSTNNSAYLTLPATQYKDVPVNTLTDSGFESGNTPTNYAWGDSGYTDRVFQVVGQIPSLPTPFGKYMLQIANYSSDSSLLPDQYVQISLSKPVSIKKGETWTYSYYYATAGSATGKASDYVLTTEPDPLFALSMAHDSRETSGDQTTWHRFVKTWTADKDFTVTALRFGFVKTSASPGWVCIDNIKLEKNATASPWSPNPADPGYYENMVDGTLSLYNQLVNNYSSIVNLYSGSTNYEKVVSMLKDSNITIQEKVLSDKAVLINGVAPNKDGIIDIDKSKISYTGSDITVPLVVTSNDTCRISYAAAGIYIRLASPGMGSNLKSDQLETNIKKA
jgi:hypothetical protein